MDEAILQRMKEVAEAISDLPDDLQPIAFGMMKDYVLSGSGVGTGAAVEDFNGSDLEGFFGPLQLDRPADAVMAIAAYIFSQYGSEPFDLTEIRDLAEQIGLTVPARIDMTFKSAMRGGKPLFRSLGRGRYAPTVTGEVTLKEEFGVTKGRRRRVSENDGAMNT